MRPSLQDLHASRTLRSARKIMLDPSHPGHILFETLPHRQITPSYLPMMTTSFALLSSSHTIVHLFLSYLIFLSYYGAYVYVYRVSLFIYFYFLFTLTFFSTYFSVLIIQYLLYYLLFTVYCMLRSCLTNTNTKTNS